ncbi:hypothetical protein [Streptomyces sp. KL116D]|uniref:hypothetical protein n=1 Tax=Streptomyces sp. KL116D TaxID=3045152 RepID=UPI003556F726
MVEHGLDRPFLLMDTVVHDGLNQQDGSWPPFWAHLSDWRRCLRLADADHNCFTDIVALAPQVPEPVRDTLQIGAIPADRAVAGVRATVRAFFDLHLRGRPDTGHVLWGASSRHPRSATSPGSRGTGAGPGRTGPNLKAASWRVVRRRWCSAPTLRSPRREATHPPGAIGPTLGPEA